MKTLDVGLGIVVRDGKVLICQRRSDTPLGGYWEFPGGKVEPGESPSQCTRRELTEEVAVAVDSMMPLEPLEHVYGATTVRLHPFICTWQSGEARPLASQQIAWVTAEELTTYRFPPANDKLIPRVAAWMTRQG
jgi:A/G-specific adenine glycosylase